MKYNNFWEKDRKTLIISKLRKIMKSTHKIMYFNTYCCLLSDWILICIHGKSMRNG